MSRRRQRVTVVRAGRDRHGDPLPPAEHEVWMSFAPRSSGEDDERGQQVTVGITGYGDYDVDLTANDQVRLLEGPYAGLWDVVGEPARWQSSITGRRAGVEVALTRTEG